MKHTLFAVFLTLTSLSAHATLIDRGNGMIYDSDQDLTWMQDFSSALAANPNAGTFMAQFAEASDWVTNLTFGGYSGWRLPSAGLMNDYGTHGDPYPVWSDRVFTLYNQQSYDGTTDRGYNNTRSELGNLFAQLGNLATFDSLGNAQSGAGLTITGPFTNMLATRYYEGDTFFHYSGESYVWTFDLSKGYQSGASQYAEYPTAPMWIAVHDGDIGKPLDVPEPGTFALMIAGVLAAGILTHKRGVSTIKMNH